MKLVNDFIKKKRGDKLIGFSNATQTVAEKYGKTLYARLSCCTKILQKIESNVLGCLSLVQHCLYQKDVENTVELHSSGFVVLKGSNGKGVFICP